MDVVSIDKLKDAVKEHHITRFILRSCSICDAPLYFTIEEDSVSYNTSCDCSRSWNIEPRDWHDLADVFNRQTPEVRAKLWDRFITKSSLPSNT